MAEFALEPFLHAGKSAFFLLFFLFFTVLVYASAKVAIDLYRNIAITFFFMNNILLGLICCDKVMNFVKRILQVLPIVVMVDDVSDSSVELPNHVLAEKKLSHRHFVAKVDVGAEDDKWKHHVYEVWDEVYDSSEVFLLSLHVSLIVVKFSDFGLEFLFPSV